MTRAAPECTWLDTLRYGNHSMLLTWAARPIPGRTDDQRRLSVEHHAFQRCARFVSDRDPILLQKFGGK